MMNTGFRAPSIPFRSIHRLIQSVLPQLSFSFYRHQPIRADLSGGQITSVCSCPSLGARSRSKPWPALQNRHSRPPRSPLHPFPSRQRLALSEPAPFCRPRRQQQLISFLTSQLNSHSLVPAEPCLKSSLSGRHADPSLTNLMTWSILPFLNARSHILANRSQFW